MLIELKKTAHSSSSQSNTKFWKYPIYSKFNSITANDTDKYSWF